MCSDVGGEEISVPVTPLFGLRNLESGQQTPTRIRRWRASRLLDAPAVRGTGGRPDGALSDRRGWPRPKERLVSGA